MMLRARSSSIAAAVLAALGLILLIWFPLHAQLTRRIKTSNFTWPEYYDQPISATNPTNRLKLLLRGAQAQYLSNDVVAITTARLEHYPPSGRGTNLLALSPFCHFDSDAHTVTGTGRVDIAADDGKIAVQGHTGFRFDMTNYVLDVSNRTRTVLRRTLMNPTNR